jgi:HEAT repeat protein
MFPANVNQATAVVDKAIPFTGIPMIEAQPDRHVEALLANLAPDNPWHDRKVAAAKLGQLRDPVALPAMLSALPRDPFWMVRCTIIQALEMIGDAIAIPTLRDVAATDDFEVVRAYAAKAIGRLTQ